MKYFVSSLTFLLFFGTLYAQTIFSNSHQIRHINLTYKIHLISQINELKSHLTAKETLDSCIYQEYSNSLQAWINSDKEIYKFNQNGQITAYIFSRFDQSLNQWVPYINEESEYDPNGNIISYKFYSDFENGQFFYYSTNKYTYKFNDNGYIETVSQFSWDETNKSWEYNGQWDFINDAKGRIIREVSSGSDVNGDGIINIDDQTNRGYVYDEVGNLIAESYYYWDTPLNDWYESGKTEYTYNEHGNLLIATDYSRNSPLEEWHENGKMENIWNELGLMTFQKSYYLNEESEYVLDADEEWTFDVNGNTTTYIFRELMDESTNEWNIVKTEYDYDLAKSTNNYTFPYSEYFAFVNKLISDITSRYMDNNWFPPYRATYYYSDDIPTATASLQQSKTSYTLNSKSISFNWGDQKENLNLTVYSISGRKVMEQRIVNHQTINLEKFSDGVYIYRLTNNKLIESGKIILH